jgi:glycosyltransferase involved in cell wall biosynthesis
MTMGRLAPEEQYKGFDEIIELLPALALDVPNLSYLIVGSGLDRARLEGKASSLGVGDRVVFAGFVPEEEKADHFRLADAFVMPGRGEGFGIVCLEAMACGVPVVASKADGSREAVLNGRLGIVVDPEDPGEIRSGIHAALSRPAGVVPDGLDYFSFENFTVRLHGVLETVLRAN